jgi:hypothetical protein
LYCSRKVPNKPLTIGRFRSARDANARDRLANRDTAAVRSFSFGIDDIGFFLSLVVVDGEEKAGPVCRRGQRVTRSLARAPVDDGGRPGKMSLKLTTSQGKGQKRNRGAVFEAELPRC